MKRANTFYESVLNVKLEKLNVLALLDKRMSFYGGSMSYKQGFMTGLVITLIVTLFTPIIQFITLRPIISQI